MTLASIALFREPGFIASLLVCFTLAYLVSMKARPGWQIALCIYFGSYDITHWMDGKYWTIALFWTYAGWMGFLFQKIGGGHLLTNLANTIKGWFENVGQSSPAGSTFSHSGSNTAPDDSHARREQEHEQAEEAFRERENQRMEEEARRAYQEAADAMEEEEEAEDTATHDESPDTEGEQKPEDETEDEEPAPEPEENTKQPWWEVLGVSPDADNTMVRKAFLEQIKKYHPDKVSHLGEEFLQIAESKTKEVNAAYNEATS